MADESKSSPERVPLASASLDFELDERQQKAVADCIRRTGKLTLRLSRVGTSRLPGRGLLDDVDGELID